MIQAPETESLDRWADDFVGFAAHLDVVDESGHRQPLRPRWIQSAFEVERSGHDIVLKPRQVGLTTWELARDIWFFLTRPGARVVIVCQSSSDDAAIKEISEKVSTMLAGLEDSGISIPFEQNGQTPTKWILRGRGASLRIIGAGASAAAAKKKGRAGTIHRLHITELAFFEHAKETLNAILECVPAKEFNSEIVIESTANGASGPYFEAYQRAKAKKGSFRAHFFSWLQEPKYSVALEPGEVIEPETEREQTLLRLGASREQIKWYRRKVEDKGQDLVDQEYPLDEETCWLSAGRLFFDRDRTKTLLGIANTVAPLRVETVGREGSQGVLRVYAEPKPKARYLITLDPSEGVGGDPGAAVVHDRQTGEHVATLHGQFSTWELARLCRGSDRLKEGEESEHGPVGLAAVYNDALVAVERNNHGHAVLQAFERAFHGTQVYEAPDGKRGWLNGPTTRTSALDALHEAHKSGQWSSPDAAVLGEFLRFIVTATGRAEGAPGAHDDLVIAQAIAWDVLTHVRWKPPSGDRKPPPQDGSRWGDQRGF